jgi:hypothetical protein
LATSPVVATPARIRSSALIAASLTPPVSTPCPSARNPTRSLTAPTVLKTAVGVTPPGVRIPSPPLMSAGLHLWGTVLRLRSRTPWRHGRAPPHDDVWAQQQNTGPDSFREAARTPERMLFCTFRSTEPSVLGALVL